MRGELVNIKLPWMISPSVSDLRVEIVEDGNTVVSAEVAVLPERGPLTNDLENRRVLMTFGSGQWVRTEPAFGDSTVIAPDLFVSPEEESKGLQGDDYLVEFRRKWLSTGLCPCSSVYTVKNSFWLKEKNAARFDCQHYVVRGHDMWIELLARSFAWKWDGSSCAKAIDTDSIR